jgi:hypothetical protein
VEVRTGNIFTRRLVVDLIRDVDLTETGLGRVMVKDGIVRLWIDVEELTVDNILSHFATVYRLAEQIGPIPRPVLIDLGNLRMVKRDARQLVAQMLKPEYNKKLAAIYHNRPSAWPRRSSSGSTSSPRRSSWSATETRPCGG